MTNRKKRLKKGIESLQEQIELHEEKKKLAEKGYKNTFFGEEKKYRLNIVVTNSGKNYY